MTEKVEIFHSKVITGFDKNGEIYQRIMPFEWQSLTDEEIQEIALELPMDAVRITEAKLKEKNHA
jgi:hypothetical protein